MKHLRPFTYTTLIFSTFACICSCEQRTQTSGNHAANTQIQAVIERIENTLLDNEKRRDAEIKQLTDELKSLKESLMPSGSKAAMRSSEFVPKSINAWLTGSWTSYDASTNPTTKVHLFIDGETIIKHRGMVVIDPSGRPKLHTYQQERRPQEYAESRHYEVVAINKTDVDDAVKNVKKERWLSTALEPDFSFPPPTHLLAVTFASTNVQTREIKTKIHYQAIRFEPIGLDAIPIIGDRIVIGLSNSMGISEPEKKMRAIQKYYDDEEGRVTFSRKDLQPFVRAKDLTLESVSAQDSMKEHTPAQERTPASSTGVPAKGLRWTSNLSPSDPILIQAIDYITKHAKCHDEGLTWVQTIIGSGNKTYKELSKVHLQIDVPPLNDADKLNKIQNRFVVKVGYQAARYKFAPNESWSEWRSPAPGVTALDMHFTVTADEVRVENSSLNYNYTISAPEP